jgi:16S rRNA (uracil1498-N3)-methyltransferase
MHRFFIPELLPEVDEVVSLAPIHKQLRQVLRAQVGTQVVVLDNQGHERLLEVTVVERRDTMARVVEMRTAPAEPTVGVTLYQSILKSDKFDLVLQKATEMGVTAVVPVISNRTVARPGKALQSKQTRWEAIAREAAEQSGRGGLPVIAPACTFAEAVANAIGVRLLPWEDGLGSPGLLAALGQSSKAVESVSILIGPEGGLEADEVKGAIDLGWQVVTLGSRILRAETAALATLAVVTAALGGLGDAPTVKMLAPVKESNQKAESRRGNASPAKEKKEAGDKRSNEKNDGKTESEVSSESGVESSSVGTPTVGTA